MYYLCSKKDVVVVVVVQEINNSLNTIVFKVMMFHLTCFQNCCNKLSGLGQHIYEKIAFIYSTLIYSAYRRNLLSGQRYVNLVIKKRILTKIVKKFFMICKHQGMANKSILLQK